MYKRDVGMIEPKGLGDWFDKESEAEGVFQDNAQLSGYVTDK